MTKEQIYDEQISPLMLQIIEICKEHKIGMLASFALPSADAPDLRCTTALTLDEFFEENPRQAKDFQAATQMLLKSFVAFAASRLISHN